MRTAKIAMLIGLIVPLLAACALLQDLTPSDNTTAVPAITATPATTPQPQTTPDVTDSTAVTETRPALIVWLPTDLAPSSAASSALLEQQIREFAATQTDLTVTIEYKAVSGQGGILSYLRTGHTVAPDILPDLIALPTDQMQTAVSDQLIYPLDDFLPDDDDGAEQYFPAARDLGIINGSVYGIPFAMNNLTHLAHKTTITGTVPATWEQLRATPGNRFVFPAGGNVGATLVLQLYLQAGGELVDEEGEPLLQVDPLAQALEQFNLARADGIVLRQSSTINTASDAWQLFDAGTANMVLTTSEQYLRRQDELTETAVAPLPGLEDPLAPMVGGWIWAVSAPDPTQQALVTDLITTLTTAETMATWSSTHNILPARRDALALWPEEDEQYLDFLQEELERAIPRPLPSTSKILTEMGEALFDVITLVETPQVAAAEAAAAINP